MKSTKSIFFFLFCLITFYACDQTKQTINSATGNRITISYAKGFLLIDHSNYLEAIIRDPIDTNRIIETYYLVRRADPVPASLSGKNIIRIPVQSIACMSTTHLGFLEQLDQRKTIIGIAGTQYVYDSLLNHSIQNGEIKEIGNEAALNYELLVELKPDVFMTYVLGADGKEALDKLKALKVHAVINNEYLELTPLGQAEWIKFVAAFYDQQVQAEDLFNEIKSSYSKTQQLAFTAHTKPTVLTGLPFRGEWTVPGGKSFAANYLIDAGGIYLWSENESTFNIPVSMEQILMRGKNAACWINIGATNTPDEIRAADMKLAEFSAFKTGSLYNNNNRMNEQGGNDYWESGIVNPHLVLHDLVNIFHPGLLEDNSMYYYKRIE